MVGWHQQHNGHKFEQAPEDDEGQGSLACCSPWGHKELDMNERLNNNKYTFKVQMKKKKNFKNSIKKKNDMILILLDAKVYCNGKVIFKACFWGTSW